MYVTFRLTGRCVSVIPYRLSSISCNQSLLDLGSPSSPKQPQAFQRWHGTSSSNQKLSFSSHFLRTKPSREAAIAKPAKVQDPACRALLGSNNVLRLLDADNIGFSYECEVCREACHCCAPLLVQGEGGVKVKSWPTGGRVLELSSLSFRYRAKVAARSSATTYGTESTRAKA